MDIFSYFQTSQASFFIAVALLSLCVGSFLNVVIYRLPIMLNKAWRQECHEFLSLPMNDANVHPFNLMQPASTCPQCQQKIRPWHNIPIISYLLLSGKCAHCKTNISWRYPFIETLTLVLSLIITWHFGLSISTLFALCFTWTLLCLSWIDLDHQILPDTINIGLLWLGLIANLYGVFCPLSDAIIGAIVGYLSLWTFATIFKLITGKQGMGHGDFKLLAALGAWLGWQLLPFIIIFSTFVGAIIGISLIIFNKQDRSAPIPFGPFLAIAGWIALLWGHTISQAYLNYANF